MKGKKKFMKRRNEYSRSAETNIHEASLHVSRSCKENNMSVVNHKTSSGLLFAWLKIGENGKGYSGPIVKGKKSRVGVFHPRRNGYSGTQKSIVKGCP